MTHEEKAKELIEKFKSDLSRHTEFQAKQCAAICAQEIIDEVQRIEDDYDDDFLEHYNEYWQSVLTSIQNSK